MRDIKRLPKLYDTLRQYHQQLPDWRFMQMIVDFMTWHHAYYGTDGYYIEDNTFISRFKEFINDMVKEEDE